MKRQRGRGRKPGGGGGGGGGNHGNRPLESNGPEVKIRGTAAQIYEKYMQYARDAQSGGDRVKYENYLQHAEHYFRIMAATMPRERMQQISDNGGHGYEPQQEQRTGEEAATPDAMKVLDEGEDDGAEGEGDEAEAREPSVEPRDVRAADEDGEGEESDGQQNGGREGRGRRRRRRHRDGQGGGNGGDVEARSALDALAQKQGALAGS